MSRASRLKQCTVHDLNWRHWRSTIEMQVELWQSWGSGPLESKYAKALCRSCRSSSCQQIQLLGLVEHFARQLFESTPHARPN